MIRFINKKTVSPVPKPKLLQPFLFVNLKSGILTFSKDAVARITPPSPPASHRNGLIGQWFHLEFLFDDSEAQMYMMESSGQSGIPVTRLKSGKATIRNKQAAIQIAEMIGQTYASDKGIMKFLVADSAASKNFEGATFYVRALIKTK